jgi:hypothetical protein
LGILDCVSRQNSASQGPRSTLSTLSSSLRGGIESLLGVEKVRHNDAAVTRIRSAMLRLHGDDGQTENPRLNHRLRHTDDAEGLWYARAELYADLCRRHNEPHAIRALDALRPLFRGNLPASLLKTRRPGDMARHSEAQNR